MKKSSVFLTLSLLILNGAFIAARFSDNNNDLAEETSLPEGLINYRLIVQENPDPQATWDLEKALDNDDFEGIEDAIKRGASLEVPEEGPALPVPLMLRPQSDEAMRSLLANNYKQINTQNYGGITLLLAMLDRRNPVAAAVLIECGADVNLKDPMGRSPISEAPIFDQSNPSPLFDRHEIFMMLVQKGADLNDIDMENLNYYDVEMNGKDNGFFKRLKKYKSTYPEEYQKIQTYLKK